MNHHVRVPLGNFFLPTSIIVFEYRSSAVKAEELFKEPHHPREILPIPMPTRQLFIQHLAYQTDDILLVVQLLFLHCLSDVGIVIGSAIRQGEGNGSGHLVGG